MTLGSFAAGTIDWNALSRSPELRRWQAEIDAGVRACESNCAYFRLCLGGAPSNKLAELGTMAGDETVACRIGLQAMVDETLSALAVRLPAMPDAVESALS